MRQWLKECNWCAIFFFFFLVVVCGLTFACVCVYVCIYKRVCLLMSVYHTSATTKLSLCIVCMSNCICMCMVITEVQFPYVISTNLHID